MRNTSHYAVAIDILLIRHAPRLINFSQNKFKVSLFQLWLLWMVLSLSGLVMAKPDPSLFGEVERIIVVGDVHGDFERFKSVLESAEVINSKGRWIAGKAHLVQLGDLPDRGPDTLEVIKFLQKLEKEARRKRGRVHVLIGNHDAMNVYGDLRYVDEGEFSAFANRQSQRRLEDVYEDEVQWIKDNNPEEVWPEFDEAFKEAWFAKRPAGYVEHRMSWLPGGEIGDWVISRNAVLKIGDSLFVHGGIGPAYADWSIDQINEAVRSSFDNLNDLNSSILRQEEGPLWYRGLALHDEVIESEHLEKLLLNFGVRRIIVGHTVTNGVILPRFGGKVVVADVGLSSYYGDHFACLVIEKDALYAIHRGVKVALPASEDEGLDEYYDRIAALEPENSAVLDRIANLRAPDQEIQEEAQESIR